MSICSVLGVTFGLGSEPLFLLVLKRALKSLNCELHLPRSARNFPRLSGSLKSTVLISFFGSWGLFMDIRKDENVGGCSWASVKFLGGSQGAQEMIPLRVNFSFLLLPCQSLMAWGCPWWQVSLPRQSDSHRPKASLWIWVVDDTLCWLTLPPLLEKDWGRGVYTDHTGTTKSSKENRARLWHFSNSPHLTQFTSPPSIPQGPLLAPANAASLPTPLKNSTPGPWRKASMACTFCFLWDSNWTPLGLPW